MILGAVIFLAVVALFVISLFVRRHGEVERPRAHWQRTDEVFRDPGTGRYMRVWLDPYDGSRHYIPDGS